MSRRSTRSSSTSSYSASVGASKRRIVSDEEDEDLMALIGKSSSSITAASSRRGTKGKIVSLDDEDEDEDLLSLLGKPSPSKVGSRKRTLPMSDEMDDFQKEDEDDLDEEGGEIRQQTPKKVKRTPTVVNELEFHPITRSSARLTSSSSSSSSTSKATPKASGKKGSTSPGKQASISQWMTKPKASYISSSSFSSSSAKSNKKKKEDKLDDFDLLLASVANDSKLDEEEEVEEEEVEEENLNDYSSYGGQSQDESQDLLDISPTKTLFMSWPRVTISFFSPSLLFLSSFSSSLPRSLLLTSPALPDRNFLRFPTPAINPRSYNTPSSQNSSLPYKMGSSREIGFPLVS
jgi:hypothetical protein